ncbi:MAG: lytic transglycosylase domain-containing protein [Bdellovibrionales bacterium]|nr:lytic transglycosylase domain-containing protein [Bdellovibrionales bacterium]
MTESTQTPSPKGEGCARLLHGKRSYPLLLTLAALGVCLPLILGTCRQGHFPASLFEARLYALAWRVSPDWLHQVVFGTHSKAKPVLGAGLRTLPTDFDDIILLAAFYNELDPNLLRAVIYVESRFQSQSISPKGAQGLMQLMPATALEMGVRDPYNPHENIAGGAKYLRKMLNRFDSRLELALAAYNAGPGTVERYKGIPPYRETISYVDKVMMYYSLFRRSAQSENQA